MKFFSTLNTQLDTAQKILELITPFVKQDKILPRTHTQINDNINDFVLLEQSGELVACAGLKNCQAGDANILLKLLMVMSAQQVALCCIQSVLKRQTLARPIIQPGIFLSQPPIATMPSKPWQPTTVSIESAITSRETKEYFIPSEPIEIPSEMVMVLKITPLPPAELTPFSASF
jgi:hypothetical protein